MDASQLFNVEMLSTMAGMVAFIMIFTQATKFFMPENLNSKIDSRFYNLFWSLVANLIVLFFVNKDYSVQSIVTALLNVILVAASASGIFDSVKAAKNSKLSSEGVNGE